MAYNTVITSLGIAWEVDAINEKGGNTLYGGWGTGADEADAADTTLSTEVDSRAQVTISQPSADTLKYVWTNTAGANETITNCGILTANEGGTLLYFANFAGVVLNSGDKIEFTLTDQIT